MAGLGFELAPKFGDHAGHTGATNDFYFGGLDQYRMAANSAHSQSLNPPKQSMRSDDVDFQRGELEWGAHNIYFDQYSWDLKWKEAALPRP